MPSAMENATSPNAIRLCRHMRRAKSLRSRGGSDFCSYMPYLTSLREIPGDGLDDRKGRETRGFRAQDAWPHRTGAEAICARETALRVREAALGSDHQYDGLAGIPSHRRGERFAR